MGVKSNRPYSSLWSSSLGVKNYPPCHHTPPAQSSKNIPACATSSSRKLPLAAMHLQPHDIKCFHIICISTPQTQGHSFSFWNGTRGKKMSVFLSMDVQCERIPLPQFENTLQFTPLLFLLSVHCEFWRVSHRHLDSLSSFWKGKFWSRPRARGG